MQLLSFAITISVQSLTLQAEILVLPVNPEHYTPLAVINSQFAFVP